MRVGRARSRRPSIAPPRESTSRPRRCTGIGRGSATNPWNEVTETTPRSHLTGRAESADPHAYSRSNVRDRRFPRTAHSKAAEGRNAARNDRSSAATRRGGESPSQWVGVGLEAPRKVADARRSPDPLGRTATDDLAREPGRARTARTVARRFRWLRPAPIPGATRESMEGESQPKAFLTARSEAGLPVAPKATTWAPGSGCKKKPPPP